MENWNSKLSVFEIQHLLNVNIDSKSKFIEQVEWMKGLQKKYPNYTPCKQCRGIAEKLKLW
jgi:glutathione peroxidase-family protein